MAKKASKLNLGESLIIDTAKDLKEKFDKKVSEGANLTVSSDSISELDLTGIQLLNYMLAQSRKKGASISLKLTFMDEQAQLMEKCGFKSITQNLSK